MSMAFSRLPASLLLSPIVLVLFLPHSICHPSLEIKNTSSSGAWLQDGLVLPRRFVAEVPPPGNLTVDNSSFILAAARTHRKDPLNGFKRYSEKHYWAMMVEFDDDLLSNCGNCFKRLWRGSPWKDSEMSRMLL
ncbi:hypothetical protein MUK42_06638 [Musa troglodytarum]|uniref:Uncharacterized protein n=1 Tax=Musa troglodytarum TaxID=320322 RepID=A0A9E7G5P7_9LILI|nr:hypothetical protein MUK42_06638 [Musa troglodytarum]